jgi:hypothetical protein
MRRTTLSLIPLLLALGFQAAPAAAQGRHDDGATTSDDRDRHDRSGDDGYRGDGDRGEDRDRHDDGRGRGEGVPPAAVLLFNARLVPVDVVIDGRRMGGLAPESSGRFVVEPGWHAVFVYVTGGAPALSTDLRLSPREEERLTVPAWEGRLEVRNATGLGGQVIVDGVDRGWLLPGASRTLVLDPGTVQVVLADGRMVLDTGRAAVRSGVRAVFVADAPREGMVRLVNLGERRVEVIVDGRRLAVQTAGEADRLSLAVGSHDVVVRDLYSGRVLRTRLVVEPWSTVTLEYDVRSRYADTGRERYAGYGTCDGRHC